jgi:hypothetical protein
LAPVEDVLVETTNSGFDVFFEPVTAANNQPRRILFNLRLLEHNTPVSAWLLGHGDVPPHPIGPGDAVNAVNTGVVNAYTVETRAAVGAQVTPSVITPNGDGRNDRATIRLVLAQFADDLAVEVEIFDLSGRMVRRLLSTQEPAGAYEHTWDGRNDGGSLVAPGLYVLRIAVTTETRTFERSTSLGVAY